MRSIRLLGTSVALVSLAACGSTVTQLSSGSAGSLADSGLGLGVDAPAVGVTPATDSLAGSLGSSASAAPDATDSALTDGGYDSSGAVGTGPSSLVASTKPIKVGIPYIDPGGSNAVLGGIGSGLQTEDISKMYRAKFAQINAAGGVKGRKFEPVFYKAAASDSIPNIEQQACVAFTEDTLVDVALVPDVGDQIYTCLAKKGVPAMSSGAFSMTSKNLQTDNLAIFPTSISWERLTAALVTQFDEMGWFGRKVTDKLGVLYYTQAAETQGYNLLSTNLKKRGLKVGEAVGIDMFTSTGDLAVMEAAVKSAELRFHAAGVNEVMCVESNAFLCGFFGLYAGQQGYYPKYGWSSQQPLTNVVANVSVKSLTGSVFIGWQPAQDLQTAAGWPRALQQCVAFFQKAGFDMTTGNEHSQAATVCEDVDYLAAAMRKAPTRSGPGLIKGAIALGTSYLPQTTFGIHVTAAHRDGASIIRRGTFVPACDCFKYTGGNITL